MQRGLIRQRWQVTIPRRIRQELNLFIGQNLTWDLIEGEGMGIEIRILTGTWYRKEDLAACQEHMARETRKRGRKKKKSSAAEVFRISDVKMSKKERQWLEGFVAEIVERHKKGLQEGQENEEKSQKKRAGKEGPGPGG